MLLAGFSKREFFFLFLLLFSVFSGAIRKWLLLPDVVNHGLLAFQLLIPWIFCIGFYPWNQSKIYPFLFAHLSFLFVLALLPGGCGFFHSLSGFLLHGGFWTSLFVFLANSNKVNWGRFYPVLLLILSIETILAVFQYVLPPHHLINQYANFNAIGDIALMGESARVTGTFSYVSGFGAYILFMSFQLWFVNIQYKVNQLVMFFHEVCLAILATLNGSRAVTFAFILILIASRFAGERSTSGYLIYGLFSCLLFILLMLLPDFKEWILEPIFNLTDRVTTNVDSGEQTSRFITPWKNMFLFSSENEWFGYGLGCTYQGANELWGVSLGILKYGYFEEELERILIEGGWFLLLLKVSFALLFIVLSSIPKGLSSLIFLLIFGYFPLVSNTYNSFFFLWGIISLSWQYEQKNRFLHS